jgi:hypothetical protein
MLAELLEQLLPQELVEKRNTESQIQCQLEQRLALVLSTIPQHDHHDDIAIPVETNYEDECERVSKLAELDLMKRIADHRGADQQGTDLQLINIMAVPFPLLAMLFSFMAFMEAKEDEARGYMLFAFGIIAVQFLLGLFVSFRAFRLSGMLRHLRHFVFNYQDCNQCYPIPDDIIASSRRRSTRYSYYHGTG